MSGSAVHEEKSRRRKLLVQPLLKLACCELIENSEFGELTENFELSALKEKYPFTELKDAKEFTERTEKADCTERTEPKDCALRMEKTLLQLRTEKTAIPKDKAENTDIPKEHLYEKNPMPPHTL